MLARNEITGLFFTIGIVLIPFLIAYIKLCLDFQQLAEEQGEQSKKYFWYCLFLNIPGMLLVIAIICKNKNQTNAVMPVMNNINNNNQKPIMNDELPSL